MPRHRESVALLSPPFLLGPNGSRYMTVFANGCNYLEDKIRDASKAHMPGQSDPSAIPFQAADRLLIQGPSETSAQFTARLSGSLDAWARAGSRYAVLSQVQAYLTNIFPGVAANLPEIGIVGGNATYTTWDQYLIGSALGAEPNHVRVTPQNWNWDGAFHPWRNWFIVYLSTAPVGITGTAATFASAGGSGVTGVTSGFVTVTGMSGLTADQVQQYIEVGFYTGTAIFSVNAGSYQIVSVLSATSCIIAAPTATVPDPGGTVEWSIRKYPYMKPAPVCGAPDAVCGSGSVGVVMADGMSAADPVSSIRSLIVRWKSGSTYYQNIIFSFGATAFAGEFSPASSAGAGNPPGTWTTYGHNVGGVWVALRVPPVSPFTCFAIGTGRCVQCSQENVT